MATLLNNINCSGAQGNTGAGTCQFDPALLRGGFLAPASFELSAADLADDASLLAALTAATLDIPSKRIYPLPPFEGITDSSEDPTIQTLGYGGKFPVREGDYNWIFDYLLGGICVNNAMRTFNGAAYKYIFFDDNNVMISTKNVTRDGIVGIKGVYFYAYPWKANDGSNVVKYRLSFVFRPDAVNKNIAFVKATDFSFADITGLQNVYLTKVSRALGVIHVTATVGCSASNLHDLFADNLTEETAWVVRNGATNELIPITGVADDTVNGGWTITLDTADAHYTANAVKVSLAVPSVLAEAPINMSGFESNQISVTIG